MQFISPSPRVLKKMELERVAIQKMNVQDLEDVFSLETSSSLTPWSKNMFIKEMQNHFSHCFVIKTGKPPPQPVIGFICFRNVADESELLNICVHPQYRQLGIGKKLMEYYMEFCSRKGIKTFYLEVDSSNVSAIHLYQCFCYQYFGMRKNFYQGKFDALLMMKKV
jgi:[ribosomal protein S18]-alanine N-acetyltransferase